MPVDNDFFVGIPVSHLSASLDWYRQLLGREPDLLDGDHAAVWDIAAGRSLYITPAPDHVGHLFFAIYVADLESTVAAIRERGIEPDRTEEYGDGVQRVAYLDPDGNEFCFGTAPE